MFIYRLEYFGFFLIFLDAFPFFLELNFFFEVFEDVFTSVKYFIWIFVSQSIYIFYLEIENLVRGIFCGLKALSSTLDFHIPIYL
jgi:hypothetical protein